MLGQAGGVQRDQALRAGEVAGVDDEDVGEGGGGEAGVLVAAGHLRADRDADDGLMAGGVARETVGEFADIDGGGGTERAARVDVRKHVRGRDFHAVFEELPVASDGQRQQGDVVAPEQLVRQVAGGIRDDFDGQGGLPFWWTAG